MRFLASAPMVFCVVGLLVLGAWPAAGGESASADEYVAAEALAKADELIASNEFVKGMLAYFEFMDRYPASPLAVEAYDRLDAQSYRIDDGEIAHKELWLLLDSLPPLSSMRTPAGKYGVFETYVTKVRRLADAGELEAATQLRLEVRDDLLAALWKFPEDPWVFHMATESLRIAKHVDKECAEATAGIFEEYLATAAPSMATYAVRVVVLEYYSKTENWTARAQHTAAVAKESQSDYVRQALDDPAVMPYQKSSMRWAEALAQMAQGQHEAALATLNPLCGPDAEDNKYKRWAAYSIPRTIHMLHQDEPEVAIAAYEEYLRGSVRAKTEVSEPTEPEFANLARVEIAKLQMGLGRLDEAEESIEKALLDEKHHEVVATDTNGVF